jgi:hypothetical protein
MIRQKPPNGFHEIMVDQISVLKKCALFSTWILHEPEAFICKALKGEVVVFYFEPLITKQMKASGLPEG